MAEKLRERYARGLEKLGYARVEGRTERYWVFYNGTCAPSWVFLGKAGAVRYNTVQLVADSQSAGDKFKARILANA